MVRTAVFAAMALATTAFAPLAQARDDALAPVQRLDVRYDDLNLASGRGVATLDRRIARAAVAVCGSADGAELALRRAVKACQRRAIGGASDARRFAIAANATRMAAR
ncbi:UrcA family protein [Novosphingobium huizhouense]|uniref:UrcA family protein n=1 Tax=Novosphingobium huizhouense TaxID=2866625 RepID=UPI001CD8E1F8|nr:UrcA family protein [Novosphingobium huizhouense]